MHRFRTDIEGLRAVAVLLVVLCHLAVPGFGGGYFGVDVFFVISGYLITGLLANEFRERGTISILGFYARRARRILPAALTVIAAIVVAGDLVLNVFQNAQIHHDAWWAVFFASNIDFIRQATNYFATDLASHSPFQHYWSLAVEEQFYLVWPALFLVVARVWARARWRPALAVTIAAIGTASLVWSVVETQQSVPGAYFSTFTRAWELALGALLAIATAGRKPLSAAVGAAASAAGVALLVAAFALIHVDTPFPGAIALLPTGAVALLIFGGLAETAPLPNRALSLPPLRFVGRISYSVYLWHWPGIIFAADLYPTLSKTVWMRAAIFVATLVAATLSYYLIEQPGRRIAVQRNEDRRRGRWQFRGSNLVTAVCGAVLLVAGFAAATALHRQGPALTLVTIPTGKARIKSPPVVRTADGKAPSDLTYYKAIVKWRKQIERGLRLRELPSHLRPIAPHLALAFPPPCVHHVHGVVPGECVVGNPAATHVAVLTGDSHSEMLRNAVWRAFGPKTWSIHIFALDACGWAGGPESNVTTSADCTSHQARVLARVRELDPDVLLLSEKDVITPTRSRSDIAAALRAFTGAAKETIVLGHTPVPQLWATCLTGNDITGCFAAAGTSFRRDMKLEESLATHAHAAFVDTSAWVCVRAGSQTVCPPVIAGVPAFAVTTHIGPEFQLKLVPIVRALLVSLGAKPQG